MEREGEGKVGWRVETRRTGRRGGLPVFIEQFFHPTHSPCGIIGHALSEGQLESTITLRKE